MPGSGRSSGEGNSKPLQYSCLGNTKDRRAWWYSPRGHKESAENTHFAAPVAQSAKNLPAMQETWVRSLGQEVPLEMEMATHSSTLGWRIPWMEEPGGLQSMGSQGVRHE